MKQFELPQSLKVEWEKNQEYNLMKNHIFITCGSKRSVRLPTTVNSGTTIDTDPDMIHQQNPPSIDLSFSKTLIDEGYISPEESSNLNLLNTLKLIIVYRYLEIGHSITSL